MYLGLRDWVTPFHSTAQQFGFCHYPNIIKYNDARQVSIAALDYSHSSDASLPVDLPLQLDLFAELWEDSTRGGR
jgi:hypothetical protein